MKPSRRILSIFALALGVLGISFLWLELSSEDSSDQLGGTSSVQSSPLRETKAKRTQVGSEVAPEDSLPVTCQLEVHSLRPRILKVHEFELRAFDDGAQLIFERKFSSPAVEIRGSDVDSVRSATRLVVFAEGFEPCELSRLDFSSSATKGFSFGMTPLPNLTVLVHAGGVDGNLAIKCWVGQVSVAPIVATSAPMASPRAASYETELVRCRPGEPGRLELLVEPGALVVLRLHGPQSGIEGYVFGPRKLRIEPLGVGESRTVPWHLLSDLMKVRIRGIPHDGHSHLRVTVIWLGQDNWRDFGFGTSDANGEFVLERQLHSHVQFQLISAGNRDGGVSLIDDGGLSEFSSEIESTLNLHPKEPLVVVGVKDENHNAILEFSLGDMPHSGNKVRQPGGRALLRETALIAGPLYLFRRNFLSRIPISDLTLLSAGLYELVLAKAFPIVVRVKSRQRDRDLKFKACIHHIGEKALYDAWKLPKEVRAETMVWEFEEIPKGDYVFRIRVEREAFHQVQRRIKGSVVGQKTQVLQENLPPHEGDGILEAELYLAELDYRKLVFVPAKGESIPKASWPRFGYLDGIEFGLSNKHEAVVRNWNASGKMSLGMGIEINLQRAAKIKEDGSVVIMLPPSRLNHRTLTVTSAQCEILSVGILKQSASSPKLPMPRKWGVWQPQAGNQTTFLRSESVNSGGDRGYVFVSVATDRGLAVLPINIDILRTNASINLEDFGRFAKLDPSRAPARWRLRYSFRQDSGQEHHFMRRTLAKKAEYYWHPVANTKFEFVE